MKKTLSFLALLSFVIIFGQSKPKVVGTTVGFLNVENLWDTIQSADYIDGTKAISNPAFHRSVPLDSIQFLDVTEKDYKGLWNDESLMGKKVVRYQGLSDDFTPKSNKNYGKIIYAKKLHNVAKVISEMGAQYTGKPPAVVGMIEVENRQVIQDVINQPELAKYDYGIIHYNTYDYRGIDVAIIYQKRMFTPSKSYKKEVVIFNEEGHRSYTRDVLVVTGYLNNEKVAFFMNHWPSRRGGEVKSSISRNAAAAVLKKEMDEISAAEPGIKMFAMGDFNDDPVDDSLLEHLQAVGKEKDLSDKKPYLNLMYPLFKKGVASLAYRDSPNLFDQIIVSRNLISDKVGSSFSVMKAEIFAPAYLIGTEGNYKGYPFRSWVGDTFTGGYSDHFPAFVVLQKEAQP
jgi:hypothetical protein